MVLLRFIPRADSQDNPPISSSMLCPQRIGLFGAIRRQLQLSDHLLVQLELKCFQTRLMVG